MKRRSSFLSGSISDALCPVPAKTSRLEVERDEPGTNEMALPSDTEAGLLYLCSLFPREKFEGKLPAIVMKHQLYSVIHDKTTADRELMTLKDNGRVRLFKLGVATDEYAVVFINEYIGHARQHLGRTALCKKFVDVVLPACRDVSITRKQLTDKLRLSEEEISTLVNHGLLLVRDVGKACSWWFAIPGVSPFTKSYTKGRAMVQQMIKRSKYKEMLQKDLESKKLSVSRLGMEYHIHDLIGAELVESIQTTSGPLLRLTGEQQR